MATASSTPGLATAWDVRPHCPVPVGHGYCIVHPWSGHSLGRPPSLPCPCWTWLLHRPPLVWPQPGRSALTALPLLDMAAASSTPGLATAWDVRPHCPVPVGHGCCIVHPWSGHSLGRPPSLPCPCWTWLLHRPPLVWPQPGTSALTALSLLDMAAASSTPGLATAWDVRPHCPAPVGHGCSIVHPWSGHSLGGPPSLPCPCWTWLQHRPPLVWPQPGRSALTALSLLDMAAASSTPGLATAWEVRPHCPAPVGHGCSIVHPWSGHSLGGPPSLPCPCWTWLLHRPPLVWPQPGRSALTALPLLDMAAASSTPGLATAWEVRPHCPAPVGHGCSILHPWSGHSLGGPPSLPCPCWTWLQHRPPLVWPQPGRSALTALPLLDMAAASSTPGLAPQPGRSSTASHEPDYQALLTSALQHLSGATQLTPKQGESISAPGGDARP